MTRAGGGRIVMIGGTAARAALGSATGVPSAGAAAAGLGNAALVNFAKHLSLEVAPAGILVNVVHPGVVATDRHPARLQQVAERMGSTVDEAAQWFDAGVPIGRTIVPEDVSGIVLFLASQRAAGITGQAIAVDGGALAGVNY
jgi:NAD(P)-dependent dehydrogenase (short-subunit alcohol dehydrogenase family)